MAEKTKHGRNDTRRYIGHNLRQIPEGRSYGNEDVDTSLTDQNYSLIKRGNTTEEVNAYRLQIEKEIFHYNRSNLVHCIEDVIQLPDDCPREQEREFFQECLNYIIKGLPMGERSVFLAEVHKDEHKYVDGVDISKPHLHVMYVPAVKDTKHEGFEYKLCADALTKRAALKAWHPGLQKHLDDCGIKATVYRKKEGDGKTIGLSVKQLKEITNKTGIVLKKSITVDQLAEILQNNRDIVIEDKAIRKKLSEYEQQHNVLTSSLDEKDKTISALKSRLQDRDRTIETLKEREQIRNAELTRSRSADIESEKEKDVLRDQLSKAAVEKQQLIQKANNIIAEKNGQIETSHAENERLHAEINSLSAELAKTREQVKTLSEERANEKAVSAQRSDLYIRQNEELKRELKQAQERIALLEKEQTRKATVEFGQDATWGNNDSWGSGNGWGNNTKTYEEEKIW